MLKVDYTCNLRDKEGRAKYWADSYVKNLLVCVNDGESVHDVVKKVLEDKDCATCAKRFKPECEMFVDLKDGGSKQIGWIYKVKHSIDKNGGGWVEIPFDAWVEVRKVEDFEF